MNKSLWLDFPNIKQFPSIKDEIEVDVAIVGGGITGISCAQTFIEEGYTVALCEQNRLFHGTTGNTTAKVTIQHELIYDQLIKKLGFEKAKQYVEINKKAIDNIKEDIENFEIDCDFETVPAYVYTELDKNVKKIEDEYHPAKKLGIDCFITDDLNLPFKIKKAVGFNHQAQFHVTKYLHKIVEQFDRNDDSYIFENTRVTNIKEDNNFCHTFTENGPKIKSRYVIVASHYPCHDKLDFYFTRLEPSTTYLIATDYKGDLPEGMFISCEKPVRSLRTQKHKDEDLLLIAGDNHETGHFRKSSEKHYENLYEFGKKYFNVSEIKYQWMTQDFYTIDKVPYIGKISRTAKNVYIATGYNKWGMTSSIVASMVLKDFITYGKSDYEALFNPRRGCVVTSPRFIKYNLKSAKKFIVDRLKPVGRGIHIDKGQGKIIRIGTKRYGAYRDMNGELHVVDIVCPHLACLLTFNKAEKTYDCPCHGSRFTYKGDFIDGPANANLKKINIQTINIK